MIDDRTLAHANRTSRAASSPAGWPLSTIFEPETAFLRYPGLGEREVLRGIYGAVRDHNWDTVPPRVTHLNLQREAGSFELPFEVACQQDAVDFFWKGLGYRDEDEFHK